MLFCSVQRLGCVVDGAARQEQRDHLVVTAVSRHFQNRLPIAVWVSVGIGASSQQQRGCLNVVVARGINQCTLFIVVNVRPAIEQQRGDGCPSFRCCIHESPPELASARIQQGLHHRQVAVHCSALEHRP